MKKNVAIFCGGPHARVIIDILRRDRDVQLIGLIDSEKEIGSDFYGLPVIGRQHNILELSNKYQFNNGLVALGDNYQRESVVKEILGQIPTFNFINAIAESALISDTASLGVGNVIMPGVIINSEAIVRDHCIINTNSSLEHNCVMADFSSLSAGVTTGGYFKLGRYSAIALGATIYDRTTIGENVVVGSGSLVTRDLSDHALYYGIPAKKARDRKPFEKFLK